MTGSTTSYRPGQWTGLVGERTWGLVLVPVSDPVVGELWGALAGGIDDVLDLLARGGFRGMAGFALLEQTETGVRYAVRAPAVVEVAGTPIPMPAYGPWSEGVLERSEEVALTDGDASAASPSALLPTAGGVTPAARLVVSATATTTYADPTPVEPPAPAPEPTPAPDPAPATVTPEDPGPEDQEVPEPETPVEDDSDGDGQRAAYYDLLVSATSDLEGLRARLDEERDATASDAVEPVADDEPVVADLTGIWRGEETGTEPVEAAAAAADPKEPVVDPVPDARRGQLIDDVPWGSHAAVDPASPLAPVTPLPAPPRPVNRPPAPVTASEPSPAPAQDASVEVTTSRAALLQQLSEDRPAGPRVLAVRCSRGHLSPSYAVACRICGAALLDQEPVEVPRPPLGRLVLSNGSSVLLDRGVVFGRAPHSDVEDPAGRPNLMRLAESGEISRMQASVSLDGWQAMLRDLGSRNGTFLTTPGSEPEQIRPHQDYLLELGSVVSLAEVVSFTYEVDS